MGEGRSNEIRTLNIDALASVGVRFTQFNRPIDRLPKEPPPTRATVRQIAMASKSLIRLMHEYNVAPSPLVAPRARMRSYQRGSLLAAIPGAESPAGKMLTNSFPRL